MVTCISLNSGIRYWQGAHINVKLLYCCLPLDPSNYFFSFCKNCHFIFFRTRLVGILFSNTPAPNIIGSGIFSVKVFHLVYLTPFIVKDLILCVWFLPHPVEPYDILRFCPLGWNDKTNFIRKLLGNSAQLCHSLYNICDTSHGQLYVFLRLLNQSNVHKWILNSLNFTLAAYATNRNSLWHGLYSIGKSCLLSEAELLLS